jgi:AcrR family transcriptional regulator
MDRHHNPYPPPARHRRKQKAETRCLILNAARRLFGKRGFEKTTMRSIAAEAGMGYGTVFKHFSNKADLLAACLHDAIEKTLAAAFDALPPDVSFQDQFLFLAGKLIRHYAEQPALSKTFIEHIFTVDGAWKAIMDAQIEQFLSNLQKIVENHKKRGTLRKEVDNDLLALSLFSSYISVLVLSLRAEAFDPDETMKRLERLIDLNLTGVLTGKERG